MKNLFKTLSGILVFITLIFAGCKAEVPSSTGTKTYEIDTAAAKTANSWNLATISINEYANQTVTIMFSARMKVKNTGLGDAAVTWNVLTDGYPVLASETFTSGISEWVTVSGTLKNCALGNWPSIYLNSSGLNVDEVTLYLKDLQVIVKGTERTAYLDLNVSTGVNEIDPSSVPAAQTISDPYITKITGEKANPYNFVTINIGEYNGQTVKVDFSVDMLVENRNAASQNLMWQISAGSDSYPLIAGHVFNTGSSGWVRVSGTVDSINITSDQAYFYLNATELAYEDLIIYLDDFSLKITPQEGVAKTYVAGELESGSGAVESVKETGVGVYNWKEDIIPSLKETYKDYFDSFGLACEYESWAGVKELSVKNVRDGIAKHADSVSMGNEFKPDGFFGWQWSGSGKEMKKFKASSNVEIDVPVVLEFTTQDACLTACKEAGLKMRGHVLAWHAQTPDNFFAENYVAQYDSTGTMITNLVSKEVMNARMEWYFKTVLEHVAQWETDNNDGEHIIWAWDVFNETVADDADETNWVRGSTEGTKNRPPASAGEGACGSRWYQVYGDTDFIVDAFRFANAYAPADVKLCYNDYNEYMTNKTAAIIKLIKLVKAGEAKTVNGNTVKPRIDVMGLQSHVGVSWPGVSGYENALKQYLELVDVHVTELDISCTNVLQSKVCWGDYFEMFQKYGKNYTQTGHHITNITLWGINNKSSWIYKGDVKYPLLFDDYQTTQAFWAVINAKK